MKAFGSTEEKVQKLPVVNIKIKSVCGKHERVIEAYSVPTICSTLCNQEVKVILEKFQIVRRMKLADNDKTTKKEIDILLGADVYWNFTDGRTTRLSKDLVAIDTILGVVLSGSVRCDGRIETTSVNFTAAEISSSPIHNTNEDGFNQDVFDPEIFWSLEDVKKEADGSDFSNFLKKVKWNEERYTVPLPWKKEHDVLPDNYMQCVRRLRSCVTRLKNEKDLMKEYDEIIRQQEKEEIVEKVPVDEIISVPGDVHYIPHHAVIRPEKETSRVRIVYDASSNHPSLNDCIEKGPCLLPLIFDILVRFCSYKVALTSDIKQAYHNVEVNEEDRDFLRFLWVNDINAESPNLVVYRFRRVIFGLIASQFLLAAAIIKHLKKYGDDPSFVEKFLRDLYADDSITGAKDVDQAFEMYTKARQRLLEGGFMLRKWHSSDPNLERKLIEVENEANTKETVAKQLKVMGLMWDNKNDEFRLRKISTRKNQFYVQ